MDGLLYLEDGSIFRGKGFGHAATNVGELVFNTSMTGYQGILTDPSYKGQIINMTYPLIGNYGVSEVDSQSERIHAFGFVTRDITFRPSNRCSVMSISEWLLQQGVPGVYNVDTRSIAKKIRTEGTVKCVISNEGISKERARDLMGSVALRTDYMRGVSTQSLRILPPGGNFGVPAGGVVVGETAADGGATAPTPGAPARPLRVTAPGVGATAPLRVAALDFGVKRSILADLQSRGCEVWLFPYGATAEQILEAKPDGLFLSNGPGDPEACEKGVATTRALLGKLPVFGICMGHQVISLATGGVTYKLKFGHRGANHGVLDRDTGRSAITSQNHSFAVAAESVKKGGMVVTHVNLNDGTVEGLRHESLPIFSVQYHPEGSPGPNDSKDLFDRFVAMMDQCKNGTRKEGARHA
jgi:carbamoyl-phosphate synthase small subunit